MVLASSVLAAGGSAGHAATSPPLQPVTVVDERITESSGLVASRRHPGTVWTVNDSGDVARIFAVDLRTGRTVGVHRYGAPVRDVEALALTGSGRLLVGDIGDNTASREVVRVFWFEEPALGTTTGDGASWELVYPDGPHDAEALAADPVTGRVVVVTKGETGGIYALPATPSRQGRNRLRKVGTVDARVTDATYLPDGSALLVRTYTSLLRLDPVTWQVEATTRLPLQPQGETVTALGGGRLLVGSEGHRSRLLPVDAPPVASGTTTPAPAPTSEDGSALSHSPTTAASPSGRPAPGAVRGPGRALTGGWRWAAAAGAALSLAAAALLLARDARRRPGPRGR